MIELKALYEKILLQSEVIDVVEICSKSKYDESELDSDGMKVLTHMLKQSCESYEQYEILGISEDIFMDTFRCFSRFIKEHKEAYGYYGFDRAHWVSRQLSLKLFRIGTLEYEMILHDEAPVLNIHIPSDATLDYDVLCESYEKATEFFATYFPEYATAKYMCKSWLLDPLFAKLLSPKSKLVAFGQAFLREEVEYGKTNYVKWIFKNQNRILEDYPEDTSLQRAVKAHLLAGGQVGEALGFLPSNGFAGTR